MQTLTVPQTIEFLQHVAHKHQHPVFMWGQPGVGKSQGAEQFTRSINGVFVDVRLSQYDSVDMRGLPVPNDVTRETVWCPPSTLPFVGNARFEALGDQPIVLFLDEMNSATASVQAVGYQLINDRRVGEHVLLPNVIVIAAGNRETDKGVTTRMPTPLANRFTHIEVGVDVDAWSMYAQQKGLPAVGIAFMQFRKPLLSTFDPSKTDKAFATPRTWEKALTYYNDAAMPERVKMAAMDGVIGAGPAAEFWGFVDIWRKMPSIDTILKNPQTIDVPAETSMRYAVSVALSGAMKLETASAVQTYLSRFQQDEFLLLAWQLAVKRNPALMSAPEFIAMATKLKRAFA